MPDRAVFIGRCESSKVERCSGKYVAVFVSLEVRGSLYVRKSGNHSLQKNPLLYDAEHEWDGVKERMQVVIPLGITKETVGNFRVLSDSRFRFNQCGRRILVKSSFFLVMMPVSLCYLPHTTLRDRLSPLWSSSYGARARRLHQPRQRRPRSVVKERLRRGTVAGRHPVSAVRRHQHLGVHPVLLDSVAVAFRVAQNLVDQDGNLIPFSWYYSLSVILILKNRSVPEWVRSSFTCSKSDPATGVMVV